MRKNILKGIVLGISFILIFGVSALAAWQYKYPINCTDNTSTTRTYYPVFLGINGQTYIDSGKITSSGLGTNMRNSSTNLKYMISTTNITAVATSIYANSQYTFDFYTGWTPEQTGFSVIAGDEGYLTTADAAGIELTGNATVLFTDAIINTDYAENFTYKENAYYLGVTDTTTNEVTATVHFSTGTINQTVGASGIYCFNGNNTRVGQRINDIPACTITDVSLFLGKQNAPTGTANVTIRKVSDDSVIGIIGTIDVSTLNGAGGAIVNINSTPVTVDTSQDIRICFEYNGGSGLAYPYLRYHAASVTNYGYLTSYNAGWTDESTKDARYGMTITNYVISTSTTTVSSGTRDIGFILDPVVFGSNDDYFAILYEGYEYSWKLMYGGTVNNTANDIITLSDSMPSFDKMTITVGGTQQLWYQPNTMIQGTNIPDRQNSYNGTITWGSNVGLDIHYMAMESYEDTDATESAPSNIQVPVMAMPTHWFNNTADLSGLPMYAFFNEKATEAGQPVAMYYFWIAIGMAWIVFILVTTTTRSSGLGALAMILVFLVFSMQGVIPGWLVFAISIVDIFIAFLYKKVTA